MTRAHGAYEGWRVALLGLLAVLMLAPVTLPVPVLRAFVQERFGVSETLTSLFMAINMMGAVLAAPLAGAVADRLGRRAPLIVGALLLDATLLAALTAELPFPAFLAVRFLEGCAHIAALSLLLGLAAHARPAAERGRVMGVVGGGLTLGVALGAMLGGLLGGRDPLAPIRLGVGALLLAAGIAAAVLRETGGAGERATLREIAATVARHRLLLAPLAFAFTDRFTVGFYTTTFSLYLSRIHELPARRIGILIFAFMLTFSLCSYPFGRLAERASRTLLICAGSLVYGLGTALVPWWPLDTLAVLMLGLGVASAVMFVPSLVITTDAAPDSVRTTALGAFNAAGSLGFIAGPLVGGLVSEGVAAGRSWEAGYRSAFAVAGASEILCVALALPFLLRLVRAGRTT
jgi:MFS family permease